MGLNGPPRQVALGFALGIMIGMTPFWGTHIFLSLGLASLLGWSKIAAMAGVNITNVVTAPLIYPLNYWVGSRLTGLSAGATLPGRVEMEMMIDLIKQSPLIVADLSIGGVVLGLPVSIAGYFLALRVLRYRRERRRLPSAGRVPCRSGSRRCR